MFAQVIKRLSAFSYNQFGKSIALNNGKVRVFHSGHNLSISWNAYKLNPLHFRSFGGSGSSYHRNSTSLIFVPYTSATKISTCSYQPENQDRSTEGEGGSYRDYFSSASTLAAALLVICASLENNCNEEDKDVNVWTKLKNLFVVEAAKAIPGSSNESPIAKKEFKSTRQQFNFIADVLEAVHEAVVCIEIKDHANVDWWGQPQSSSNGSGFIVKEDGLILTNAHVVANQQIHQRCSISVKLPDGRCFAGYIEDVDYESDLATLRVRARGLPTIPLGTSEDTRIGEWVLAVGSPLNLSNSVTAGIISSNSRGASELGIHNDIKYIQTDAAITFGNSGGPLINLDGEVIGINSMKVTPGISFAIPIDHVKTFLARSEHRRVSGKEKEGRRYVGLTILTLTDEIRQELSARTGMEIVTEGVFVWQVIRGGPAFLGGLQPGDVIIKINERKVTTAAHVHEIIKTDDMLRLEVQRGDKMYGFTVVPENVI